jgi:hydroxyacid-oxoacid transhydrogenase
MPPAAPVLAVAGGALRFGAGALDELGAELAGLGVAHPLVIADAAIERAGTTKRALASLAAAGLTGELLLAPGSEPTDAAIEQLSAAAGGYRVDAVVGLGGGTVIDAAKGVALLLGAGGQLLDYVNPPFGAGLAPRHPPLPLVAVPTTAGSGSEVSSIVVLDLVELGVKTGISHARLRPRLALADPTTTCSLPPGATAAAGLDALSHALESLTARRFDAGDPAEWASARGAYSGANPYSDALCERALPLIATALPRAVRDGAELRARSDLMLGATLAALGAAVAGAHLAHACSYAIATTDSADRDAVPHGLAVAAVLPETLRFSFEADPAAHLRAAELLGGASAAAGAERLPAAVRALMRAVGVEPGLAALNFAADDVPGLAAEALRQERLVAGSPSPVSQGDLERILEAAVGAVA